MPLVAGHDGSRSVGIYLMLYLSNFRLCWEKFGWTIQKIDELITPVPMEYNKHEAQLRLEAFYTVNERFAKIRGARIKKAMKGMTGNLSLELLDDAAEDAPARRRKHKVKNEKRTILVTDSMGADSGDDEIKNAKNSSVKKPRKSMGDPIWSEEAGRRSKGSEESNAKQRLKRGKRSFCPQKGLKRNNILPCYSLHVIGNVVCLFLYIKVAL